MKTYLTKDPSLYKNAATKTNSIYETYAAQEKHYTYFKTLGYHIKV